MSELNAIQRCLVTGASGFLGGYLLSRLRQKKIFTRVLLRSESSNALPCDETVIGELLPTACCKTWLDTVDTVFYLVGTAHLSAAPEQYQTDHLAVINMARQAAALGVKRFVFVSTTKAAADPAEKIADENWDAWPIEPYGYWKRKTEIALGELGISQLAIVRPCLMYGAGVKGNLQKMIQAVERGFFPPLADIKAQRSMVFAGDVVEALLLAATQEAANHQPLIVADGESYVVSDLYAAIRAAHDKKPATWHIPLPLLKAAGVVGDAVEKLGIHLPVNSGAVKRLTENAMYSSAKLRQLGWVPSTTFYRELPSMILAQR